MTAMRIAYLMNQYPKVSHSFIRSEIKELERQGVAVDRFSIRGWDGELVDPADKEERLRTRYVLHAGALRLASAAISHLIMHPILFSRALGLAFRLALGGERGIFYHLIYLAEACLLLRWITRTRCTNLHAHFGSNAAAVAALTRMLGGPPYSITIHGSEEFDKPLQLKLRLKISGAAFVAGISSFCRSQIWRWAQLEDWSKVHIVRCGLDQIFLDGAAAPIPTDLSMVCVGRLCGEKAQLLLVEACALLATRGLNFKLVLAGDGDQRVLVEKAIARLGLDEQITITGWLSAQQVVEAIEAARIFVLPSFAEGLPVVLMEAMARGRVPVTSRITGIPELVDDGITGFLVTAGDVKALADALEHALNLDDARLNEMGEKGRARVRLQHAIETEAAKLPALFANACQPVLY